jgi:hypothetical protein
MLEVEAERSNARSPQRAGELDHEQASLKESTGIDPLQSGEGDDTGKLFIVSDLFLPCYSQVAAGSPKA